MPINADRYKLGYAVGYEHAMKQESRSSNIDEKQLPDNVQYHELAIATHREGYAHGYRDGMKRFFSEKEF